MLEGVAIELCVVVEVAGVRKEIIAGAEHIAAADIRARQSHLLGAGNLEAVLGLAVERFAHFVAQVGVGVLIANNLHSVGHARRAMVGGQHHFVAHRSNTTEHLGRRRVAQPTECETTVGCLIFGELAPHLALGAGVG